MNTTDPRAELAAVLTTEGPAVALHALRWAIGWSVRALAEAARAEPAAEGPDTAAIEVVIALDDALAEVEHLAVRLSALTEVAATGEPVADHLRRQVDSLTALADRTAVLRREHEALARVEERLAAGAAEHERVSARLEELKRFERLADALPELKAQQESLSARLAAMRQPAEVAERALLDTAEQVLSLSLERLGDLSDRTGDVLAKIAASERDWAEEVRAHEEHKTRLADTLARYERLRTEHAERAAQLLEYARIDTEILAGLPAGPADAPDGDGLRAALDATEHTLRRVDEGLRAALDKHARLQDAARRMTQWYDPVTDDGTGGSR
ncbi:hypothetical protein ACFV4N_42530 [Actinosynnema sp. NPDC059797]